MKKRISLVTGASRGFGHALALALSGRGDHVVALARTTGGLEELDEAITARGGTATLVPLDITDRDGVARLASSLTDRWGGLDLWVHAAIFAPPLSPASDLPAKDFARSFATNLSGTAHLIAALEGPLRARRGVAAFLEDPMAGQAFAGAYGAAKAAQIALARSWSAECVRLGPLVRFFTPDPMPTALRARFFPGEDRTRLADPPAEAARLLAALD
jgi:hypothetical protein